MPYINDENGKRIRVWTTEELRASYQRGYENAGGDREKMGFHDGYTEEELKAAYEEGLTIADRLNGAAARAGFEEGYKDGETLGKIKGHREAFAEIDERVKKAQKEAEDIGYVKGCKAKHADVLKLGYKDGYKECLNEKNVEHAEQIEKVEKQLQTLTKEIEEKKAIIEKEAVARYQDSRRFSVRISNQLNRLHTENALQTTMRVVYGAERLIMRLPLSGSNYKYYQKLSWQKEPLRLGDYKLYPRRVGIRLGILGSAAVTAVFVAKEIGRAFEQYQFGETNGQYQTRKEVEASCQQLQKLTPTLFQVEAFSPEHQKQIDECKAECGEVAELYKNMRDTMQIRRALQQGDQRYFGVREKAGYKDTKTESGEVVAIESLAGKIKHTSNELLSFFSLANAKKAMQKKQDISQSQSAEQKQVHASPQMRTYWQK